MDIKAHVVRQFALDEDVVDQAVIARAVQDGVVACVGPHVFCAERADIPDEQAQRPAAAFQPPGGPAFAGAVAQQAELKGTSPSVIGINAALGEFEAAAGVLFSLMARVLSLLPLIPTVVSRLWGDGCAGG